MKRKRFYKDNLPSNAPPQFGAPRFPYSPSVHGPRRHSDHMLHPANQLLRTPPAPSHHNGVAHQSFYNGKQSGKQPAKHTTSKERHEINVKRRQHEDRKRAAQIVRTIMNDKPSPAAKDLVVLSPSSSPERPNSSKRRRIITIESDGEGKKEEDDMDLKDDDNDVICLTKDSVSLLDIPPKYNDHLTSAISRYYAENKQDKNFLERKLFLRDGVQKLVQQTFGEGLLHLTGSSMSGFGTLKSDADMALIFNPNVTEIAKKKSRNIIGMLARCLRRQAFCSNVEMIFAKVPIIKFFDTISQCDVDININNIVGIKNSFLLRSISLVDARISPLAIVIKTWAKSHDINSAFKGSLSSYCLVTMLIYYLQAGVSPPILPPLKPYVDKLEAVNVNTELQQCVPSKFINFKTENEEDIGQLFVKFFEFWTRKFKDNKLYSVYRGSEAIRTYNKPMLDTEFYVFVIQEPFQKDNVARAVRGQQFDGVKFAFNEACTMFKNVASFSDLFGDKS